MRGRRLLPLQPREQPPPKQAASRIDVAINAGRVSGRATRPSSRTHFSTRLDPLATIRPCFITAVSRRASSDVWHAQLTLSDVFGPLAACGNCEKTKKSCTFEWLRSQRVSQATPQPNMLPPAKRRRRGDTSTASQKRLEAPRLSHTSTAPQSTSVSDIAATHGGDFVPRNELAELGVTFADFPTGISAFDMATSSTTLYEPDLVAADGAVIVPKTEFAHMSDVMEDEDGFLLDQDSGKGSSLETSSEGPFDSPSGDSPRTQVSRTSTDPKSCETNEAVVRLPRKRRRRSSSSTLSSGVTLFPSLSSSDNLFSSTNNAYLAEGLLKIYQDSFENALSCWLTERTCPYSKDCDVSLADDTGPDWNRIYRRVFRLDRIATPIRGRHLTMAEDKAASRAINLAIFSFATQWAQSSQRSKAGYPFHSDGSDVRSRLFKGNVEVSATCKEFDRALQISAWHEARLALQNVADVESFRVALAQIVFSLTQKPAETGEENRRSGGVQELTSQASPTQTTETETSVEPDDDVSECEDLLSKLNLAIEGDGPPVHLEQGLRLIHSLRSRMTMADAVNRMSVRGPRQSKFPSNHLNSGDRATVDLLFWLGVMFDTLSSAMHKRPLVVSDEDSDIYSNEPRPSQDDASEKSAHQEKIDRAEGGTEGLWDEYLFARQRKRIQGKQVRWPCSYDQAASLLCDAAPVKVLLFRKVTRIQTLLSRNVRSEKIERAVRAALDVYDHWDSQYAPFIRDCTENHDRLPLRIQSWYICLTGHWHLATLLLADLIEIIDSSELGVGSSRKERMASNFVKKFRETNCHSLSDLARCACPREDASFAKSHDFHFAVNQGALLTEPWTAVLIRAFAKAGVALLEPDTSMESCIPDAARQEDAFRRADDCVKALWYLGRKSDMALSASRILGDAIKQRRKGAEERVNDMSSFLKAELWEGFEEMNPEFGVDCV